MKSIVKYRGGKAKEIQYFEKYIPKDFDTYYEPFFGGGAVYFHLEPSKAVINDVNSRLMNFYKDVQTEYSTIRTQLDELQFVYDKNQKEYEDLKRRFPDRRVENKNEALYYELREMFNHKIPPKFYDSVVYFFINKTAYSGMIRYNAQGEYNVPFGRYKNFNTQLLTEEHSLLLNKAEICIGDYSCLFKKATKKDFMFLDPPYDCIFNDYGNIDMKNGFDEEEHRRLAEEFKKLKCSALMVIGKTPLTEELYKGYIIDEYFKSYAVNIRNRFKAESKHIVVANYL